MNILAWLIFIPLQLVWIPIQIVASAWVAYKQLLVSKRLGVSQTAIEIFNGRWMMTLFALRDDPAVLKLGKALPNTSVNGLFITLFPFWVKWKLSGQHLFPRLPKPSKAGLADLVPARTVCFDSVLDRRLPQVQQFVMLGAGYDTRAYRSVHGARVFEVDQQVVQAHKLSCINAAGIAHDHVTFVSIDFSREKVLDRLTESGFDSRLPTVFLWEGVTLYLSEEAVRATIGELRDGCAPGSVVVADFYGDRVMKRAKSAAATKLLELTGETVAFGFSFATEWEEELRSFVESEGCAVGESFFLGRSHKQGPFVVVAELLLGDEQ